MGTCHEDKRRCPRFSKNLKVNISGGGICSTTDLCEDGLNLSTTEVISSPVISLTINFPDRNMNLNADVRLMWKRDLVEGGSTYGVEFIDLDESQRVILRQELIKTQVAKFLDEVTDAGTRQNISDFFLKDVLGYITEISSLHLDVSDKSGYSAELQKKFDRAMSQIVLKGYCLDELLGDKKIMQKVKEHFRHLVGTWIYKSIIVKRAFEKPRGYPGDYKMLEIVYDNKPMSQQFGVYSDSYFLRSPYAVAVRIRKDRLRMMIQDYINKSSLNKIEVLNIACGSCREILELLPEVKNTNKIKFTCLDWDEEALDYSYNSLSSDIPKNVELNFVKEDIMNMAKNKNPVKAYGEYDLIYSIGLIDYLPDRLLKKLIFVLHQLLKMNGTLILTHKDKSKTFPPIPPDWFCDWKFVQRNKDEANSLFYDCGISTVSLSVETDDFGYIHYFTLVKK